MAGEAKQKNRSGRRAHLNSFVLNAEGDYGYQGISYAFEGQGKSRKRFFIELWILGALAAAATILAGCIPAPGMDDCFYVLLPYLGEVAAVGRLIWALIRLTAGGDPLRAYVFEATVEKIPRRAVTSMVFAGIGAVGCIIFLIFQEFQGPIWGKVLFFVLKLLVLVTMVMIKCRVLCAGWRKQTHWPETQG